MTPQQLVDQIRRVDPRTGKRVYSEDEIDHVTPLLVLFSPGNTSTNAPLMRAFELKAGLTPTMSDREMIASINQYYDRAPPNPALMQELTEGFRAMSIAKSEAASERAKRAAAGTSAPKARLPYDGLKPPKR